MLFWSNKNIENDRICLHLLSQKKWTLKLILDMTLQKSFYLWRLKMYKLTLLQAKPLTFPRNQCWRFCAMVKDLKCFFCQNFTELNFIEQCWVIQKEHTISTHQSKEEDLEKNLLSAVESVPLEIMQWYDFWWSIFFDNKTSSLARYTRRARRFMDAYWKGLNGKEAAWASKKYRGHWVFPESLAADLEKAKLWHFWWRTMTVY